MDFFQKTKTTDNSAISGNVSDKKENMNKIIEDLNEIKNLSIEVSTLIEKQNESLEHIEDHIDTSNNNINKANKELKVAKEYSDNNKTIYIGAMTGTITGSIFGPVGALSGTLIGGVLGFLASKII